MRNTKLATQVSTKNIMEQLEDVTTDGNRLIDDKRKKRQTEMINRYKIQEENGERIERLESTPGQPEKKKLNDTNIQINNNNENDEIKPRRVRSRRKSEMKSLILVSGTSSKKPLIPA